MNQKRRKVVSIISLVLVAALLITLLVAAIGSAAAVSQSDINSLKNQQTSINSQKKAIQDKISGLEGDMSTYMEKKEALDEQNELARQEIELINEQIDLYEKLIEEKEIELEEAKAAEEKQKEDLRVRMRAMEENGTLSYIAILFKATSFTDFLAKLADVNTLMKSDKALEEEYIAARENVEKVKAEYEQTLEEQKDAKVELEEKKADLELQIQQAVEVIQSLEADIAAYQKEYEANAAQEAAVQKQILQLQAQLAAQNTASGTSSTKGSGSYQWPVAGTSTANITSEWGYRIHPIFGTEKFHAGVDIAANAGTTIMAADSGTVLTAVYNSSYGNYVVIDHGNGITSLYAHMTSYAVSAGQSVSKGQTIGYVGSTGWSTGPHCHFEIRLNGSSVNPRNYF